MPREGGWVRIEQGMRLAVTDVCSLRDDRRGARTPDARRPCAGASRDKAMNAGRTYFGGAVGGRTANTKTGTFSSGPNGPATTLWIGGRLFR